MVGAGLASAALLAVAGIASANAAAGSPTVTVTRPSAGATAISQADAERTALAAVSGSTVTEARLDSDRGRIEWNVHLSTPSGVVEVKVDAQTGTVRIDDGDDAPSTGPTTGGGIDDDSDDGTGHDADDDHGRGSHDGPGHS
jgi:hypothetical protein